jgi:hypothetical protein
VSANGPLARFEPKKAPASTKSSINPSWIKIKQAPRPESPNSLPRRYSVGRKGVLWSSSPMRASSSRRIVKPEISATGKLQKIKPESARTWAKAKRELAKGAMPPTGTRGQHGCGVERHARENQRAQEGPRQRAAHLEIQLARGKRCDSAGSAHAASPRFS